MLPTMGSCHVMFSKKSLGDHELSVCTERFFVAMFEASCPLLFLCLEVACVLATASICLQCTADWSAACNCTLFSYSAARLLMLLWRRRCATVARRLLDAEGWRWHQPSRSVASTSCFCSIGVARSFACFSRQLWNRKSACCPSWPAENP